MRNAKRSVDGLLDQGVIGVLSQGRGSRHLRKGFACDWTGGGHKKILLKGELRKDRRRGISLPDYEKRVTPEGSAILCLGIVIVKDGEHKKGKNRKISAKNQCGACSKAEHSNVMLERAAG